MEQKIKNYLWIALTVAVLVGAYAAWRYADAFARSIQPSSFRSFTVSSEGKTVVIPDVAEFSFTVLTEGGKDLKALQDVNAEKMNRAIAFVKSNGVDAKDVRTASYQVEPRYQYYGCRQGPCPPPEIVGYTVRQTVSVKVRDFAKVGDILAGVVENGANTVSDLRFTLDDRDAAEATARAEAIAKAEVKAEAIAEAAGVSLGRLLSIDEGSGPVPVPYYALSAEQFGRGGGGAIPAVEPGSEEIRVTVILRYEIR